MARTAAAFAGEPLDALVWRTLGRTAGVVEATLALTPGLATIAAAMPAGTTVTLPDLPSTTTDVVLTQLWD